MLETIRRTVGQTAQTAGILVRAGVLRPEPPLTLWRVLGELRRWGPSPAAGIAASAIRRPEAPAVIDEAGSFTFREIHRRSNALARALQARGIAPGASLAVLCRNHHGFIETTLACAKLGVSTVFMNTMFSGPQLAEVAKREGVQGLVYDGEFAELLEPLPDMPRFVAWREGELRDPTLDELIGSAPQEDLDPPRCSPRFVILTSGTTGTPKGAGRRVPPISAGATLLSRIPLRARERTMIAAPLFHSWGFAHFNLGIMLSSTYVLRRRFDPEETLRAAENEGCTALVVVPLMLQRILKLPDEVKRRYPLRRLRVTAVSGSALPGELALEWMDHFGNNLYNLYGSTEVAWATIASPEDLRAAPGTAGRPPFGTRVRVVGEQGRDVPSGVTGRIFVGNGLLFEGYTGGGSKPQLEGLMATGDVGHFDSEGRLFIDGRDDEMIVSGGENVFPREVEDLLASQAAIDEVAVVGVPDREWGQRLKAFVVLHPGERLSEADVKDLVRRNLAAYKVPREVVFLDALPRNATGKILKRELLSG